jgi:sec-independent protein translocase protein TatA
MQTIYFILGFISGQEIVILGLAVLILFGSKKIPEMARGLGKGMREFRKAADDIKRELNESTPDISDDLKDMGKDIKDSTSGMVDDFKKFKDDLN